MLDWYQNLSLRWKVPIRAVTLALITAVTISAVLLTSIRQDIRKDFVSYTETMLMAFSSSLITPLHHQDIWRAFEVVRAYKVDSQPDTNQQSFLKPYRITVLDQHYRVFVSTDPTEFAVSAEIHRLNPPFSDLLVHAQSSEQLKKIERDNWLYLYLPIMHNGLKLGSLIVEYDTDPLTDRLQQMVLRAIIISLALLLLILAISWQWGKRFATPLINLANCMEQIGKTPDKGVVCTLSQGQDELGRLGRQFHQMTEDMAEKFRLEQRLLRGERMAALGRMASGIAHEVNNPLGGMLNAINTQRKHGQTDPFTEKTINLLERGLNQIRDTVTALLVEAKLEQRDLTPQDFEDVLVLTTNAAKEKHIKVLLESGLTHSLPLPANLIRQIFINLLLNAIKASYEGNHVFCRVMLETDHTHDYLTLRVANSGETLEESKMSRLFEPNFGVETHEQRGFGLWIIYQLVTQLEGTIFVSSDIMTEFKVVIPLSPHKEQHD